MSYNLCSYYYFYYFYLFLSIVGWKISPNMQNISYMFYFSTIHKSIGLFLFDLVVVIDWMSVVFLSMLLLMGGSVGCFSIYYMASDPNQYRFFIILNLFILSMMVLILIPHYVFFLVGWDSLGFTSFLLMKYYNSSDSWTSSFKTFLMNRLGDGFLLGSMGMYLLQGHFWFFLEYVDLLIFFLLLFGLLTKSANYPFSTWLPSAMAAPTPVSALVHSSTLVTAGLYMLIRVSFHFCQLVQSSLLLFGLLTLQLGVTSALFFFDSKKVVAFSTLSKLGILSIFLGFGFVGFAFFHLVAHGLSKALLFISVGNIMQNKCHVQDLRGFSGMWLGNIISSSSLLWSLLSLSGFLYLSCYFSKDSLFEVSHYKTGGWYIFWKEFFLVYCFLVIFIITFAYSCRLVVFVSKSLNEQTSRLMISQKIDVHFLCSSIFLFNGLFITGFSLSYRMAMEFSSFWLLKIGVLLTLILSGVLLFKILNEEIWKEPMFWYYAEFSDMCWFANFGVFALVNLDQGMFSSINSTLKHTLELLSYKYSLMVFQGIRLTFILYLIPFFIMLLLLFFF